MLALYESGASCLEQAGQLQDELLSSGFYDVETRINKISTGLGLTALGMDTTTGSLSGGQRAKVILAKLLLEEADILLLDEPTNFLDSSHVDWLSEYLKTFPGAYLIVSHDYDFINRISTGILDIEFGTIKKYNCGYKEFLRLKTHLRENYVGRYHAQQREIGRTEAYIRRNIAGQNTKIAQGRRTRLERMERLAKPEYAESPNFRFANGEVPAGKLMEARNLCIGYSYPLLPSLSFTVQSGQKVAVTGFNGMGKSTLLKTLLGVQPAISGGVELHPMLKIGYYEQELRWDNPGSTPLDLISGSFPLMKQKEIRRALAQCGIKAEHTGQPISTLSGGEQSKVKLCRLILGRYNFLILDEPTNHLDGETKEVLEKSLINFNGSVILVTHEERFYRHWADRVLKIG